MTPQKPVSFARGTTTFLGTELLVAPGALLPREETELLGLQGISLCERTLGTNPEREVRVVDMCSGSGNLACAIARHIPRARVWAADLTAGCVELAMKNVQRLGLQSRVTVAKGDLFAPLAAFGLEGTIDVIVCNPPYISTSKLAKEHAALLVHEPREAFDGGPYGLSIHQRVIKDALSYLRPEGWLTFEIGVGQERQLRWLFERAGGYQGVSLVSDDAGRVRVVMGQRVADHGTRDRSEDVG